MRYAYVCAYDGEGVNDGKKSAVFLVNDRKTIPVFPKTAEIYFSTVFPKAVEKNNFLLSFSKKKTVEGNPFFFFCLSHLHNRSAHSSAVSKCKHLRVVTIYS